MKNKRKKKDLHSLYLLYINLFKATKNNQNFVECHQIELKVASITISWYMFFKCQGLQDWMEVLFDSCPGLPTEKGELGWLQENSKRCRLRKQVQRNFKYFLFQIKLSFKHFVFYPRDSLELVEYQR